MPYSATIQRDDLTQAGLIGLCDAARLSSCPLDSKKFKNYAGMRIYGAVIDEIRLNDFVARCVRDSVKNGTADEYAKSIVLSGDFLDIEDFQIPESVDPLDILIDEEEKRLVNDAADKCEPRDRLILDMLYNEGITKREVAERIGVHESRVNQLHKRAIDKIKDQLCT
jgi:RNA polymerase sigma factor for flagellar operon FliA